MKLALLALLVGLLAACTPLSNTPAPAPTSTSSAPTEPPDASAPPPASPACEDARQHMVEIGCPPPEDAFGGWVLECSGRPNAGAITTCVLKADTCLAARNCLGDP